MKRSALSLFVFTFAITPFVNADTFGSGDNQFEIPFVTIGDPGNVADTTGAPNPAGSVGYAYRIGKYEIPEEAIRKANILSDLDGNPLGLTLDERGSQKPATSISWYEAARFVNWLNEEKGATPAYKFDTNGDFQLWEPTDAGYNANNRFRNSQAAYFLPSVDEWYKAAFYDPVSEDYFDYPTGSDIPPSPVVSGTDPGTAVYNQAGPADVMLAGGASPYGVVGHAGNVFEWDETASDLLNDVATERRGVRGNAWIVTNSTLGISSSFRNASFPTNEPSNAGFRVASVVPEPQSAMLCLTAIVLAARYRQPLY